MHGPLPNAQRGSFDSGLAFSLPDVRRARPPKTIHFCCSTTQRFSSHFFVVGPLPPAGFIRRCFFDSCSHWEPDTPLAADRNSQRTKPTRRPARSFALPTLDAGRGDASPRRSHGSLQFLLLRRYCESLFTKGFRVLIGTQGNRAMDCTRTFSPRASARPLLTSYNISKTSISPPLSPGQYLTVK